VIWAIWFGELHLIKVLGRLSIWHGNADRTVNPVNADEIIKQWLAVHRLSLSSMSEEMIDGHPRKTWRKSEGHTVIESFTISNMAHGTPLPDKFHLKVSGAAGLNRSFGAAPISNL
jgi:poly(3-hydroxybutyrate) depolymerase